MAIDLDGAVAPITGSANRRYGRQDSLDAHRLCRADEVNLARQG